MFGTIYVTNFDVPLAQRREMRKHCGPYMWTAQDARKREGVGFYQHSKRLEVDKHGSTFRLRLEEANDHLPVYTKLTRINGYYCDSFQNSTLKPIVARLPHGRGFLAGWTMGNGMYASLETHVWDDIADAARRAHDSAEHAARQMQEDDDVAREEE